MPLYKKIVSDWTTVINKPTTISGYGITDAYTKTESDIRYLQSDYTALPRKTIFFQSNGQTIFDTGYTLNNFGLTSVYINGIYQNINTFSISGSSVTLDSSVQFGDVIEITSVVPLTIGQTQADLVQYIPDGIGAVPTDTQTAIRALESLFSTVIPSSPRKVTLIQTENQQVFDAGFILSNNGLTSVYINGVYQNADTFIVNANTVTLNEALLTGNQVEITQVVPLTIGQTQADLVQYIPAGIGAVPTDTQTAIRALEQQIFGLEQTNLVYTTGSYSDPIWLTAVNYQKLIGTVPTWNQNTTGQAATLTTSRNISMTGDVQWSTIFNGSSDVSSLQTLSATGVAPGTYTSVAVDAKGRVTSASNPTTLSGYGITDAISITEKGMPNGIATLDSSGLIHAIQLPSYVDDVLEYADVASFPITGVSSKIYVALDTNKTYRWGGQSYVYITSGAVDSVSGKTGVVTLVKGDVGLSNVDNTSDSQKNVYSASKITTPRSIGGISFDGSSDINLPGVNQTGNQNTTGNAATSSSLASSRSIQSSGDVQWSVNFDGSANVSSSSTLASTGVIPGTYNTSSTSISSFTVDAKGRISSVGQPLTITPSWSDILVKPTTISGYGITDAYTKTESDIRYLPSNFYGSPRKVTLIQTENQQAFDAGFELTSNGLTSVYINGVYQNADTFIINQNIVTLSEGTRAGDIVEITSVVPLTIGQTQADLVQYIPDGIGAVPTDTQTAIRALESFANGIQQSNLVYTTGSYSDPQWIVQLQSNKLTGIIASARLSGSYDINITGVQEKAYRNTIHDTRTQQLTPNDYSDYSAMFEFTDKFETLQDWHQSITLSGWHDGYTSWQIIGPSQITPHENWYLRSGVGQAWNPIRKILHSGNYQSYALSNVNPSYTGTLTGGTGVINIGSGQIVKDASGNVGIGTASPTAKLSLKGNSEILNLNYASDGGSALVAWKNSAGSTLWDIGGGIVQSQDELVIRRAGSAVALFNSAGNLGLGVTPSAWGMRAMDIGEVGGISCDNGGTFISKNAFDSTGAGGWKYKKSESALLYLQQAGGNHAWYTAPSGTAGNPISFTQAMTLDAGGKLTTASGYTATCLNAEGGIEISSDGGVGGNLCMSANGSNVAFGMNIRTHPGSWLKKNNALASGGFVIDQDGTLRYFRSAAGSITPLETTAMTLDTAGNLLVGASVVHARLTTQGNQQTPGLAVIGNVASAQSNVFTVYASQTSDLFNWVGATWASNQTANTNVISLIGKSASALNSAYIGFKWKGEQSSSNMLTLGLFAADNVLNITGGQNVGIGTETPAYKLEVNGSFAATTKSFVIDHPTKTNKRLRYGSLEGPENGVYVRGKLKGNVIVLPEYWTKLVDPDSITVQLTPIGKHQKLYVEDIRDNKVYVGNDNILSKEVSCFYYVLAERVDVEKLKVEIDK